MKILKGENVPIKSWCNNPEGGAIEQAKNLSSLPFLFRHICLMPDTHQGYGMPIGGVIACKGVVIPNAVGVDIGCGMVAVQTTLSSINTEGIKDIMGKIRQVIPVGFNRHKEQQAKRLSDLGVNYKGVMSEIICKEYDSALYQIGTLGGGNHFIEIQQGDDGFIWIMLHSGSRNIGYKVANQHNKIAKELNTKWHTKIPPSYGLSFLPMDSLEGKQYFKDMQYCLDFAYASRQLMMKRIKEIFSDYNDCKFTQEINIHHNYAAWENHFGQNVIVHRKGATSAKEGELGLIPGSQGSASYIVVGKGNKESFMSCSHGAGRRMSRSKARQELNLEEEQRKLDELGIVHAIRTASDLDEASSAYKDIDVVMEEQKDLVDIVVKLKPLGVIKA